jgi:hypothetical protein
MNFVSGISYGILTIVEICGDIIGRIGICLGIIVKKHLGR